MENSNQVVRPIIPIGKVSVALDIVFYIDQNGNIHDDEWDFDGKIQELDH